MGASSSWLVSDLSKHGLVAVVGFFLQSVRRVVAKLLLVLTLTAWHEDQRFLIHGRLGMIRIGLLGVVVVYLDGPVGFARHFCVLGQFVRWALLVRVVVSQILV